MRFAIRDLLWLMVVVALGVGWTRREWEFRRELALANAWRVRAGALEYFLSTRDWQVTWDRGGGGAIVTQLDQNVVVDAREPSEPR
jgi:hypothetical protein